MRSPFRRVTTVPHRAPRQNGKATARKTPSHVMADIVRAVIFKLGKPTASEIAAEVNRAQGSEIVTGRAIRWLAQRAGAQTVEENGERRYTLATA
jgi:hypothetical protein